MFNISDTHSDKNRIHSQFWLGSDWSVGKPGKRSTVQLLRLQSARRSVANFVNILCPGKNFKVVFKQDGKSYTDGNTVVIGAALNTAKDFDVNVGVALHEASHCLLTDFDVVKNADVYIYPYHATNLLKKGYYNGLALKWFHTLNNIIEDRRIDTYVYNTCPGYREYYHSFYDEYFNNPIIDKALKSDSFRDESWDSYDFRLTNMHNPNTVRDALNGLPEILDLIDLENIDRLQSTQDVAKISNDVLEIIINNLPDLNKPTEPPTDDNSDDNSDGGASDDNSDGGTSNEPTDDTSDEPTDDTSDGGASDEPTDDNSDGEDGDGNLNENFSDENDFSDEYTDDTSDEPTDDNSDDSDNDSSGLQGDADDMVGDDDDSGSDDSDSMTSSGGEESESLTSDEQKELKKAFDQQQKFNEGNIDTPSISKEEAREMKRIEESGTSAVNVGAMTRKTGSGQKINSGGIDCIVVKNMTESIMKDSDFPIASLSYLNELTDYSSKAVLDGIKMGTILGKKLQVRSEQRDTIFNRQKHGRIDKRRIADFGYGADNAFFRMETDIFNKAHLHISIDASSSMSGTKWKETMQVTTALCKAVDMISNLEVKVTFRSTSRGVPYVVLAYDSMVDKFIKVRKLFPYLRPSGTTPEGLCFEAIMDEFVPADKATDSYFLNISDGEPWFSTSGFLYAEDTAVKHTKKQVDMIRQKGINVLSYFISSDAHYGDYGEDSKFKKMYGSSAKRIDVTKSQQVIKTMNQLFLSK